MACEKEQQNITVKITKNFQDIEYDSNRIVKLVKAVCHRFGLSKAIISIAIVPDKKIIELNKRFLNHNSSTDCLSFDLSDSQHKDSKTFEIIVNGQKACEQAKLRGHTSQAELALYITHGLLHNLGFDDDTAQKAKKMHDHEDEILQQQGYGRVYKNNFTI